MHLLKCSSVALGLFGNVLSWPHTANLPDQASTSGLQLDASTRHSGPSEDLLVDVGKSPRLLAGQMLKRSGTGLEKRTNASPGNSGRHPPGPPDWQSLSPTKRAKGYANALASIEDWGNPGPDHPFAISNMCVMLCLAADWAKNDAHMDLIETINYCNNYCNNPAYDDDPVQQENRARAREMEEILALPRREQFERLREITNRDGPPPARFYAVLEGPTRHARSAGGNARASKGGADWDHLGQGLWNRLKLMPGRAGPGPQPKPFLPRMPGRGFAH